MRGFDRRIEQIEKRIPQQNKELEEVKRKLEKENPGYEFLIGIQNGIVNYVQLPKTLTPEEWMREQGQTYLSESEKGEDSD